MAGKNNRSLVAVLSNLTSSQVAHITADIMRSKQRYAPRGRGTIASGLASDVGKLLQKGQKKIGG